MRPRLFWRRSATAVGLYLSAALGILASVIAARALGLEGFGRYATVVAAVAFFAVLLDLTVEEALTKYGFRYITAGDWGRLRRLFALALRVKLVGGALAGVALVALAPAAEALFDTEQLLVPMLVAAPLPLLQAPENVASTALLLRERYDLRGWFLSLSMALRLVGIAAGAQSGVTGALVGLAVGQTVASAAVGVAGVAALRRFPAAAPTPLGEHARELRRFVLQSSAGTGVVSLRGALAPLVLGVVAGSTHVGLLRVAQAPQSGFATLSSPVRLILLTEQTRDWERGDRRSVLAGVRRYMVAAAASMAISLPVFFVLMPHLVRIVFGAEYLGATDAARIVLVAAGVQFVVGWSKSLPVSIGRPHLRVVAHGVETAVLLPLVAVLGSYHGVTGAAWAVLAATVAFAATWALLLVRLRRDVAALDAREALAR
jgi:O-antigen/teichoic acid export membrane protein